MGKLFGTDGIRGVVGENLTADLAFRTGKAIAAVLKEEKGRKPVITIGKDTRISSDMLESALIAGICSVGGDVMPFGVLNIGGDNAVKSFREKNISDGAPINKF